MPAALEPVFDVLRAILAKHAGAFTVSLDTPGRYCLEGVPGPATLRAWRGKLRRATIPVAWVTVGKRYVSYHQMGVDPGALSEKLALRMQGKTCFNFRDDAEPALFAELAQVTSDG
jgi:hypothetical protein